MANSNLADISAFESLQSDQHSRTGINSMSVFQNNTSIHNAVYKQSRDLSETEKTTVDKIKKNIEKLEKPTKDSLSKLLKSMTDNETKRNKLQTDLDNTNKEITELSKKYDNVIADFEGKTKPFNTELQKYGINIEKFDI
jgi:predicted  nucleic acid-binding Zn-ribbon protein